MRASHSFVVCTKDRADTLNEFISELAKIKDIERCQILVVENSPTQEPFDKIESYLSKRTDIGNVQLLRSSPGLSRSRNLALASIKTNFVHFVDDDVILPLNFIIAIENVAKSHPEVIGFAPFIVLPNSHIKEARLKRYSTFRVKLSWSEGKLNKFGRANWLIKPGRIVEANWLPGCCMTYRTSAIEGMKFDENLENGPLGGYALGEDLVFSHQVSQRGKLAAVGIISVIHKLEPNDRTNWSKMDEGIGRLRAYLRVNFPTQVKLPQVFLALFLEGLNDFLKSRILKTKSIEPTHRYFVRLLAFIDEHKNPLISQKKDQE